MSDACRCPEPRCGSILEIDPHARVKTLIAPAYHRRDLPVPTYTRHDVAIGWCPSCGFTIEIRRTA